MSLGVLLKQYADDITCVAFMGGDATPAEVNALAAWVRRVYPDLAIAWYSGRAMLSTDIQKENFDYIKLGPYVDRLGPLNRETTNQRLYKVLRNGEMKDITKSDSELRYGAINYPSTGIVNVNPDVRKLVGIGWRNRTSFRLGIMKIICNSEM